jgi:hypothetical protein
MDLKSDIPIFHKTYDLYKTFYEYSVHFPKKDRYTLGQKIENNILELLELVVLASQTEGAKKLNTLKSASVKLDMIKILVRLCKELKAIDTKKYLSLSLLLQEIGKMLGGWIKASS